MSGIGSRILCAAIVLCGIHASTIASSAEREPYLLLHDAAHHPLTARPAPREATTVGLNEKGDMEIRHGGMAVVVAYNPPEEIIAPTTRPRNGEPQDLSISGLSIRFRLCF